MELQGTGLTDVYFKTLMDNGGKDAESLLQTWAVIAVRDGDTEHLIRTEILDKSVIGALARSVIKMWYLGSWNGDILSGEGYVQGLVWDAVDAHPQAAKQQGFGVWAFPPGWNKGDAA